jgi:hypothetical protein
VWAAIIKSECGCIFVSPSCTRSAKYGHACQGLPVIRRTGEVSPWAGTDPVLVQGPRDGLLDRLVVQVSSLSRSVFNPYRSFSFTLV